MTVQLRSVIGRKKEVTTKQKSKLQLTQLPRAPPDHGETNMTPHELLAVVLVKEPQKSLSSYRNLHIAGAPASFRVTRGATSNNLRASFS